MGSGKKDLYMVMDGRAAEDPADAVVLDTGTAEECCKACNDGEYGKGCLVVSAQDGMVKWEWFSTGKWIPY